MTDKKVLEGPRRKSLAGPLLMAASPVVPPNFAVRNTYVRGQEKGIEGMRKQLAATEDLKFEGNLNVASSMYIFYKFIILFISLFSLEKQIKIYFAASIQKNLMG